MKQTDALQHGRMAVKDHFPDMGEQEREQIASDEVFGVISYLLHESESHHNIMNGSVDEHMSEAIYFIRWALIERKNQICGTDQ